MNAIFVRITVFLIMLFCVQGLNAQVSEYAPVGVRAIGLGSCFIGVADDATATFWNPAGIPLLEKHEIQAMHSDLFNTGIAHNFITYVIPVSDRYKPGISWSNMGFNDNELNFQRNIFTLSNGLRLTERISLGLNVKYYSSNSGLDGSNFSSGYAVGLDAGALVQISDKLRLGIMGFDLTDTKLRYKSGSSQIIYPKAVRAGGSYQLFDNTLLAFDIGENINMGMEFRTMQNQFAIRGGIGKDINYDDITQSVGASFRYKFVQLDYAFTNSPGLPYTHRYAASFHFDLFGSDIIIRDVSFENIFPAHYHRYGEYPAGNILLENKSDKDIDAEIKIEIPDIDTESNISGIFVAPETPEKYDLNLNFPDEILNIDKNRTFNAKVSVMYKDKNRTKTERKNYPIRIYSRNKVKWETIDVAAAFITSKDPNVEKFSSGLLQKFDPQLKERDFDENIMKAMLIFDALKEYGIKYKPDALTPYNTLSNENVLDEIKYPTQLLELKVGDCDDCSVLFASLLESIGIETALVDAPGHIFILFNSGLSSLAMVFIGLAPEMVVEKDGMIWIPVEITKFSDSFIEAWKTGASEMENIDITKVRTTAEAWSNYQSHQPSFSYVVELPSEENVQTILNNEKESLKNLRRQYINSTALEFYNQFPDDFEVHLGLANAYAYAGLLDDAVNEFNKLILKGERLSEVYNNLGNAHALSNNYAEAINFYNEALKIEPDDEEIKYNLDIIQKLAQSQLLPVQEVTESQTKEGISKKIELKWKK